LYRDESQNIDINKSNTTLSCGICNAWHDQAKQSHLPTSLPCSVSPELLSSGSFFLEEANFSTWIISPLLYQLSYHIQIVNGIRTRAFLLL
jgi:hypothetical protein